MSLLVLGCAIGTNDGRSVGTGGASTGTGSGGMPGTGSASQGGNLSTGSGGVGGTSAQADASDAASPVTCPSPPAGVKAASCGYYVEGNKVKSVIDRTDHLFHGVARPSLEWSMAGEQFSGPDADRMKSWNANTVRFALNQAFWLQGPGYKATVAGFVRLYEQRGLDVILDLHWNIVPAPGGNGQQNGPDANSATFWAEVAAAYKNDGHVLFELYNEPHDISDEQWYASMSGLYNAVRNTAGADNLVIIGGVDWAFDLTVMSRRPIAGYNIMLASHPYQDKQDFAGKVDSLASSYPIILTEFGDRSGSCSTTTSSNTINHANQMGFSWTAWAWYPQTGRAACTFPSLISDWNGTVTEQGTVAKNALLAY
jgi:endoglucanase